MFFSRKIKTLEKPTTTLELFLVNTKINILLIYTLHTSFKVSDISTML